jgi:hypothetical protein
VPAEVTLRDLIIYVSFINGFCVATPATVVVPNIVCAAEDVMLSTP